MKLIRPPAACELTSNLVDPLGNDQHGSIHCFGEKVPQRTVEASRQYNPLTFLRHEGK